MLTGWVHHSAYTLLLWYIRESLCARSGDRKLTLCWSQCTEGLLTFSLWRRSWRYARC